MGLLPLCTRIYLSYIASIVTKTYENDVPAVTLQIVDIHCLFIFVHDMTYTRGLVLWKDITNMHKFFAILL
jgi:hypothetical protein